MHSASLGLRFMTNQGQRIKYPGMESSEVKQLMNMPKKVQGMETPNMAVLLTGVAWRTKDIDTYRNTFSSSMPHQNFPCSLCSDKRLKMLSDIPRKDCVELHGPTWGI